MEPESLTPLQGDVSVPVRVSLSRVDTLPLKVLPAKLDTPELRASISELATAGLSTPAMRRLLARDIELSRTLCRYFTALANTELRDLLRGKGSNRRVRLLQSVAEQHHRRMLKAIEMLSRLSVAAPAIRVCANNVGIAVQGGRE